jgi:RNA polymerase sigma-B factor
MTTHATVPARSRDEVILEHMGFVRALARRYADRGEPFEDVVQAGMVGLINAVDRYDPSRGFDFRSFAAPTILGEIRRHFRDRTWAMKVPRRIKDDSGTVAAATEKLSSSLGHTPTVAEIADETGLSVDRVLDALAAHTAYSPDSLSHTPWLEDGGGGREIAEDEAGFGTTEDRILLDGILDTLPPRERVILHLRFEEGLLQSQIAERVGISQMHVSRLIARSLATLREVADGKAPLG